MIKTKELNKTLAEIELKIKKSRKEVDRFLKLASEFGGCKEKKLLRAKLTKEAQELADSLFKKVEFEYKIANLLRKNEDTKNRINDSLLVLKRRSASLLIPHTDKNEKEVKYKDFQLFLDRLQVSPFTTNSVKCYLADSALEIGFGLWLMSRDNSLIRRLETISIFLLLATLCLGWLIYWWVSVCGLIGLVSFCKIDDYKNNYQDKNVNEEEISIDEYDGLLPGFASFVIPLDGLNPN